MAKTKNWGKYNIVYKDLCEKYNETMLDEKIEWVWVKHFHQLLAKNNPPKKISKSSIKTNKFYELFKAGDKLKPVKPVVKSSTKNNVGW